MSSADEILNESEVNRLRKDSAGLGPKAHPSGIASAILPSLSSVHTTAHTPIARSPSGSKREPELSSAEDFFDKSRKVPELARALGDTVNEKLGLQRIQPRSKFSNAGLPSLVVEPKKRPLEGLPGMKISRASSFINSSPASAHRSPSIRPGSDAPMKGGIHAVSRQFLNFSLEKRASTSAVFSEDEDLSEPSSGRIRTSSLLREPFDFGSGIMDYDDDQDVERLAPFGGFLRSNLELSILNRENIFSHAPWHIEKAEKGNGSLTKAVELACESGSIKSSRWVGAMSLPCDAVPLNVLNDISDKLQNDYGCDAVFIDDETFQGHYNSFCKQILWPTLHYQIPDDPKSKAFEEHLFNYYKRVNQMVADKVVEAYRRENKNADPQDPQNMIWIHDYHLFLVPAMVREECPEAKIGFFLHVSFPSSEVFRCLAQREALLKGVLGADCITFQIQEYVRHFLQTCSRLLLADSNEFGLVYNGEFTKVNTIPVGIDVPSLQEVVASKDVQEWQKMIRDRWREQTLIVSRDKLDKLRGVKQKLLAYEQYLRKNPEKTEHTVMIQIFIGLQDDPDYETEVMGIISRINSLPKNIYTIQPVVVLRHDIDFDQYIALLAEADAFIVSSMREGLNVTCHEFIVATQVKKSPLIISEFTGSSNLLQCDGQGALLVNPWDTKHFGEQIELAMEMSPKEKEARWSSCFEVVKTHNSISWVESCIESTKEAWLFNQDKSSVSGKPFTLEIFANFMGSTEDKRLFIINVDDPSLNFDRQGGKSALSLSRVGLIVNKLLLNPKNIVLFASIMSRVEMELLFNNVGKAGLIAEFGGYIKLPGKSHWISIFDDKQSALWTPQVAQVFEAKAERLPGSKAIVDDCTVRLVANTALVHDPKRSADVMGECIQYVDEAFGDSDELHATIIDGSVVVQQKNLSIRAVHFLISYYSSDISSDIITQLFNIKRVESVSGMMFRNSMTDSPAAPLPNGTDRLSHFFYSGGLNPIDEGIYDIAHSLQRDGLVKNTLTVAVNNSNSHNVSSADYSCMGQNKLFAIIGQGTSKET